MHTPRFYLLALILLAIVSSACAPTTADSAPLLMGQVAQLPQPTPRPSDFPVGRFGAITAPNMVLLVVHNDRTFQLFVDNDLLDSGAFVVAGAQVSVESQACALQGNKPALYSWLYDEEQGLVFEPVGTDPCPERQQYLSDSYKPKYMFVYVIPHGGVSREWLW